MRKLLLALLLIFAGSYPANATYSLIQHPNGSCTSCGSSPTITFTLTQSTGSGHLLVLFVVGYNGAVGQINSISGGGSWTVDTNCHGTNGTVFAAVSCAYVLTSSSGASSLTITMSANNNYRYGLTEYSFTGASVSYATSGTTTNTTNSNTQTGVTLSGLTGNNVIVRGITENVAVSNTISSPYTIEFNNSGAGTTTASADSLNTATGTGPTWTLGASSGGCIESGIAFKEAAGGSVTASGHRIMM